MPQATTSTITDAYREYKCCRAVSVSCLVGTASLQSPLVHVYFQEWVEIYGRGQACYQVKQINTGPMLRVGKSHTNMTIPV